MTWEFWLSAALALLALWLLWRLRVRRLARQALGDPSAARASTRDTASDANQEVLRLVADFGRQTRSVPARQRLAALREGMDTFAVGESRRPDELGVRVQEANVDGVSAEWVLAPDADPNRRMLYLHGGAFFVGSPLSHRPLTAELAKRTGLSVLVIDYRLMPESKRLDGIVDCHTAYLWILRNGPGTPGAPTHLFVAGDSAGGNLTLMMTAWIRNQQLRQVDGAVALSPATDSTFGSPSLRGNVPTDAMLGPGLGRLMKLPTWALLGLTGFAARMSPRNPLISPLHGDLSNLPPTLVQASESEMLFDDARRYVQKAQRQGSPVMLQTWPGMVHVWQIFHHVLPEANEALDGIAKFIGNCQAFLAEP